MRNNYIGIFDVIGPVMVGPSSSHTSGAALIAWMTRQLFTGTPVRAAFTLYGSFADTYKGHGTDRALVGGLLGYRSRDTRIRDSFEHAKEEGIDFRLLNNPVEILGYNNYEEPRDPKNGFVRGIRCIKMELGEPDASGRRRPIPIEGSEFELEVDAVIMALGTRPNPLIKNTTKGLEVNRKGGFVVDEDGLTSREAVYAGGDAVTGAATVISAMGAGKLAAASIDKYLSSK